MEKSGANQATHNPNHRNRSHFLSPSVKVAAACIPTQFPVLVCVRALRKTKHFLAWLLLCGFQYPEAFRRSMAVPRVDEKFYQSVGREQFQPQWYAVLACTLAAGVLHGCVGEPTRIVMSPGSIVGLNDGAKRGWRGPWVTVHCRLVFPCGVGPNDVGEDRTSAGRDPSTLESAMFGALNPWVMPLPPTPWPTTSLPALARSTAMLVNLPTPQCPLPAWLDPTVLAEGWSWKMELVLSGMQSERIATACSQSDVQSGPENWLARFLHAVRNCGPLHKKASLHLHLWRLCTIYVTYVPAQQLPLGVQQLEKPVTLV